MKIPTTNDFMKNIRDLQKELDELMSMKGNEMGVIWETDELVAILQSWDLGVHLKPGAPGLGDGMKMSQDELTAFAHHWLDLQGFDVTRKEPEIKACPNPTCERTKFLEVIEVPSRYAHPNKAFIVECQNCGYRGGRGSSKEQAIKLHNLICEKTVVTNVANISALPRRNGEG